MRILQLANFGRPGSTGSRVRVEELAIRYAAAGHRVLTIVPGERDQRSRTGSRTVVTLESPPVPGLGGYRAVVDLPQVRRLIADFHPDVVELFDMSTLALAVLRGTATSAPVVLLPHERLDVALESTLLRVLPARRWSERWSRWLVDSCDTVVCTSTYHADQFERRGHDHTVRLPLGVDLDTFRPPEGAVERSGSAYTMVLAGLLSPEKHPQIALDAVRRLRARGLPVRMVVAGSGPLDGHLRRAARGLPVEFLGHVADRAELAAVLGSADVALATGPVETFGLAALEAMACGTPIVVPPSGALRELVAIGAGVVAAPHTDGFADAAAMLLIGDRNEQRRRARERAAEFSWDRASSSLLDLHASLVARGEPTLRRERAGRLGTLPVRVNR